MQREIADVLETVKRAKERDKACILLIGAGCSVKAGIPSATEFIEIIRKIQAAVSTRTVGIC